MVGIVPSMLSAHGQPSAVTFAQPIRRSVVSTHSTMPGLISVSGTVPTPRVRAIVRHASGVGSDPAHAGDKRTGAGSDVVAVVVGTTVLETVVVVPGAGSGIVDAAMFGAGVLTTSAGQSCTTTSTTAIPKNPVKIVATPLSRSFPGTGARVCSSLIVSPQKQLYPHKALDEGVEGQVEAVGVDLVGVFA